MLTDPSSICRTLHAMLACAALFYIPLPFAAANSAPDGKQPAPTMRNGQESVPGNPAREARPKKVGPATPNSGGEAARSSVIATGAAGSAAPTAQRLAASLSPKSPEGPRWEAQPQSVPDDWAAKQSAGQRSTRPWTAPSFAANASRYP